MNIGVSLGGSFGATELPIVSAQLYFLLGMEELKALNDFFELNLHYKVAGIQCHTCY